MFRFCLAAAGGRHLVVNGETITVATEGQQAALGSRQRRSQARDDGAKPVPPLRSRNELRSRLEPAPETLRAAFEVRVLPNPLLT